MLKQFLFLATVLVLIAELSCQRIIRPTYRPPPRRTVIIRTAREAKDDQPLWLYKGDNIDRAPATGDHPYLPKYIDDIKLDPNRRYARSLDSPSAKRGGGSHTTSRGSGNTGPTHPGYNRRNAREIRLPKPLTLPKLPEPYLPTPSIPIRDLRPLPIYARVARDIQFPGIKKPSHRDVIIPNWNPNVRTQPWHRIGVKTRRSVESAPMLDV